VSEGVSLGLSGSGVVGTGLGAGLPDFPVRGEPPVIARTSVGLPRMSPSRCGVNAGCAPLPDFVGAPAYGDGLWMSMTPVRRPNRTLTG